MLKMQMPNCAHLNARGIFLSESRRPLVLELKHRPLKLRIWALTSRGHKLTLVKFTPFEDDRMVRVQDFSLPYIRDGYYLTPTAIRSLIRNTGFPTHNIEWLRKPQQQLPRQDGRETISINLGTRIDLKGRTWIALFTTDVHGNLKEVRGLECWSSTKTLSRIFGPKHGSKFLRPRRVP